MFLGFVEIRGHRAVAATHRRFRQTSRALVIFVVLVFIGFYWAYTGLKNGFQLFCIESLLLPDASLNPFCLNPSALNQQP